VSDPCRKGAYVLLIKSGARRRACDVYVTGDQSYARTDSLVAFANIFSYAVQAARMVATAN
jgi:hypothetical protein